MTLYLPPGSCKVNIGREYSSEQNLPSSVPQGSCAGAQILTVHEVVDPPLNRHGFTDDHIVEDKLKAGHHEDEVRCIHELEKCAVDLKVWMDKNDSKEQ